MPVRVWRVVAGKRGKWGKKFGEMLPKKDSRVVRESNAGLIRG